MKKLLCIPFSCVILLSFSSCSLVERFAGDMSQLEYDEDGDLSYNGNVYYRDDRFEVRTGEVICLLFFLFSFSFVSTLHIRAYTDYGQSRLHL